MRLIDADALKALIDDGWSEGPFKTAFFEEIDGAPTIDPVKHGRWQITEAYPHNVYCSACHAKFAQTHWAVWEDGSLPRHYCPNCGARMERSEE